MRYVKKERKPIELWQSSVWTGGQALIPNLTVPYDPHGAIAYIVSQSIACHRSQSRKSVDFAEYLTNYAAAKILRETADGYWRNMDASRPMALESYDATGATLGMQVVPDEVLARAEELSLLLDGHILPDCT